MKRFHSPLQSIQRVLQQQLRMAELNLAHVLQEICETEKQIQQRKLEDIRIKQEIVQQFSVHSNPHGNTIRASRARMNGCQADLQIQSLYREQLLERADKLKTEYRTLKARSDGVDQLIEKRRQEHRRQQAITAQTELEESARSQRLLNEENEMRLTVEDGVIQQ